MNEPNVAELIESWINGNRSYVIDVLEANHPSLTAVMIVQGCSDETLSRADANSIANILTDRNVENISDGSISYRGCYITPKKGVPRYFGVGIDGADNDGFKTEWVRVFFYDQTWILCPDRNHAIDYIDRYIDEN